MIVVDKRKKNTVLVQGVELGMVFEDLEGNLFMKIALDSSCYPSGFYYDTSDAAVDLEDFEVYFFHHGTEVCPVNRAELVLS
jgi:hypothetical protein